MKEGMLRTITRTTLASSWIGILAVLLSIIVNGFGKIDWFMYMTLVASFACIIILGIGIVYLRWNKEEDGE